MAWRQTGTTGDKVQWREDSTNTNVLLPVGEKPNENLQATTLTNPNAIPRRFDSDIGEGAVKAKRLSEGYTIRRDDQKIQVTPGGKMILPERVGSITETIPTQKRRHTLFPERYTTSYKQEILPVQYTTSRGEFAGSLLADQGYSVSSSMYGGVKATKGDTEFIFKGGKEIKTKGQPTDTIRYNPGQSSNIGTGEKLTGSKLFFKNLGTKYEDIESKTASKTTRLIPGLKEGTVKQEMFFSSATPKTKFGRAYKKTGETIFYSEQAIRKQIRDKPITTASYFVGGTGFGVLKGLVRGKKATTTFKVLGYGATGAYATVKAVQLARSESTKETGTILGKTGLEVGLFSAGYKSVGGTKDLIVRGIKGYKARRFQRKEVEPFYKKVTSREVKYKAVPFLEIRETGTKPAQLQRTVTGDILTKDKLRFLTDIPQRRGEVSAGVISGTEQRQTFEPIPGYSGARQTSLIGSPRTTPLRNVKPIIERSQPTVTNYIRPTTQKSLYDFPTINTNILQSRVKSGTIGKMFKSKRAELLPADQRYKSPISSIRFRVDKGARSVRDSFINTKPGTRLKGSGLVAFAPISFSGTVGKQTPNVLQLPRSLPRTRTNINNRIGITDKVDQKQDQDLFIGSISSFGGGDISPPRNKPPSIIQQQPPPIPFKGGFLPPGMPLPRGGGTRPGRRGFRGFDWTARKVPSIRAKLFNIRGKYPDIVTGLEVRPIPIK